MAAETFDDVLNAYQTAPANYRPNLYVFLAVGEDGKTTAGSLGPMPLPSDGKVDEPAVWRGICARLGNPGRIVVRLHLASGGLAESVGLTITEALWKVWGPTAPAPAPAAPPPPVSAPVPVYAAPPPPPDMMTVMLQGMQQTQQLLIGLIAKPQENPAIAVLQAEVNRLQQQLAMPHKQDREDRQELIELAVKAAKADGGGLAAAATLLQGPFDKIADAMADAAKTRAQIELRNAETRQLVAATKAEAAGVKTIAEGDEGDDADVNKPAATA